jgi:uncharacterized protein (TIGR03067 family)
MNDSRFPRCDESRLFRSFLVVASGLLTAASATEDVKGLQRDLESLKGVWRAVHVRGRDEVIPKQELDRQEVTWTFKDGGKAVFGAKDFGGKNAEYTYKIDPSNSPKAIDITYVGPIKKLKGHKQFGIYKLEKGKLTLCLTGSPQATEKDRPKEFVVKDQAGILLEMERQIKK